MIETLGEYKMGNDIIKKILLGLIVATILVVVLDKTGLVGGLFKQQDTSNASISTSETATNIENSGDETSETSRILMYSSIIGSMFR